MIINNKIIVLYKMSDEEYEEYGAYEEDEEDEILYTKLYDIIIRHFGIDTFSHLLIQKLQAEKALLFYNENNAV